MGSMKNLDIRLAALRPSCIDYKIWNYLGWFILYFSLNFTITESVSPYITSEPGNSLTTLSFVKLIIYLPYAVTEEDI